MREKNSKRNRETERGAGNNLIEYEKNETSTQAKKQHKSNSQREYKH